MTSCLTLKSSLVHTLWSIHCVNVVGERLFSLYQPFRLHQQRYEGVLKNVHKVDALLTRRSLVRDRGSP